MMAFIYLFGAVICACAIAWLASTGKLEGEYDRIDPFKVLMLGFATAFWPIALWPIALFYFLEARKHK